jgi:hypothetical protein
MVWDVNLPPHTDIFMMEKTCAIISPSFHIQAISSNNGNSRYSNYIHGTITDTMDIIKIEKIGKNLNTLQKYHTRGVDKMFVH